MTTEQAAPMTPDRRRFASRKVVALPTDAVETADSISSWTDLYVRLAVVGVRSAEVEKKIRAHLQRFAAYVQDTYGHERLSMVVRRDVAGWRVQLHEATPRRRGLASTTVNLHMAHLRGFL